MSTTAREATARAPGELIEQRSNPEPVIAVAVRNVNCRQVLSTGLDPIGQYFVLVDSHKGVDENRIPLAVNERRGNRRKETALFAGRRVAGNSGNSGRNEQVPFQGARLLKSVTMISLQPNKICGCDR
jgi:hypothetical protein